MSDFAQFIAAMPKAELHVRIEGTIEAQRSGDLAWESMISFMRNGFASAWLADDQKAAYLKEFDRACDSRGKML